MIFKADIAILLNITPDHLDRYDYNFQKLCKFKIQSFTKYDSCPITFIYFQESEALAKELTEKNVSCVSFTCVYS